jgi:hypothetical protein
MVKANTIASRESDKLQIIRVIASFQKHEQINFPSQYPVALARYVNGCSYGENPFLSSFGRRHNRQPQKQGPQSRFSPRLPTWLVNVTAGPASILLSPNSEDRNAGSRTEISGSIRVSSSRYVCTADYQSWKERGSVRVQTNALPIAPSCLSC